MSDKNPSFRRADALVALVMMGVLAILLVPLPPVVLDLAITVNLTLGLLILLVTLTITAPLDFSTFPSLLLFTTLFRLALNVASTRLILSGGDAGRVIEAFGRFVVGGDLLVGIVIFLILVIIQFVVITKGSGRISEVAARFTLDAMPGKQMAIDADLNAGLITEKDARARREAIAAEAEFYGAMDGAGKFVRGDAIAGLIITAINIIGGVAIGVGSGMTVSTALARYATLTVGDGLISQIPALVISVAAGTLVTKAKSDQRLSVEMLGQFFAHRTALRITAIVVTGIGLLPDIPALPFLLAGGALLVLSRPPKKTAAPVASDGGTAAVPVASMELTPEVLAEALRVDRIAVEVGYRLVPLAEKGATGGILEHTALLRRQFAQRLGFVVPPIRLRDNLALPANGYRVLLSGEEVARAELEPGHLLAMDPGGSLDALAGIATTDPTFGIPATWIPERDRSVAEHQGFTVIEPEAVLVTHLTEIVKEHAHEILSREDVQAALDRVKETHPAVVQELVPDVMPLGTVQKVLASLLRDRIPLLNLPAILETLADTGRTEKDPSILVEGVRQRLARSICELHTGSDGALVALTVEPGLEQRLTDLFHGSGDGSLGAPTALRDVQDAVFEAWRTAQRSGQGEPVIVVRPALRRHLADLLRPMKPTVTVLSLNEVVAAKSLRSSGMVSLPKARPIPTPAMRASVNA